MAPRPMPPRDEQDEQQLDNAIEKHPKAADSIGAKIRDAAKENA